MKLYEEFRLYENMWNNTWDKLANVFTLSTEHAEDPVDKYTEVMYSIYNRDDFIEKAQEIYDNMPISAGFRIQYDNGKSTRMHKLADGSLEVKIRGNLDSPEHSTIIIDPKKAVSALQAYAMVEGSTIWTSRRHDPEYNHNKLFRLGYKVILPNGKCGTPVGNQLLP